MVPDATSTAELDPGFDVRGSQTDQTDFLAVIWLTLVTPDIETLWTDLVACIFPLVSCVHQNLSVAVVTAAGTVALSQFAVVFRSSLSYSL